jgi:hypothetical protein
MAKAPNDPNAKLALEQVAKYIWDKSSDQGERDMRQGVKNTENGRQPGTT